LKVKKIVAIMALLFFMLLPLSAYSDDAVPDPGNVDEFGVPNELDPGNEDPGDPDPGNVDPGDPEPGAGDAGNVSYEKPSYQNAAQAQHAANLQEEVLAKDPELNDAAGELADAKEEQTETGMALREAYKARDAAQEDLDAALQARADAKQAYDDAVAARDHEAAMAAKKDLDAARLGVVEAQEAFDLAEEDYGFKDGAYDDAKQAFTDAESFYADKLAERTGVTAEQIHAMRQEMGWGAMYRELGVHPGVNGLKRGHYKNGKLRAPEINPLDVVDHEPLNLHEGVPPDQELMEATQRNTRTGWSDKHGLKLNNNKSSKKGLGLTQTSEPASSDVQGSRGNKGSKGNSSKSSNAGKSNNGRSSVGGPADKDDNGKGRGNSNKSSRGNSGNKGKNGNNGNKGGNGKNK
jgi:hypothetical protein